MSAFASEGAHLPRQYSVKGVISTRERLDLGETPVLCTSLVASGRGGVHVRSSLPRFEESPNWFTAKMVQAQKVYQSGTQEVAKGLQHGLNPKKYTKMV